MGQLTLARFRGDTTFGLVARIISTFAGGLTGTAIWHISTGGGKGNPYGLAVTCAAAFPFFFYGRLYWPGPSASNMIFFTTTALVGIHPWKKKVINGANPCSTVKGNRLFMAEYSLPLWRVLVLRNKPRLGTWFQVCRSVCLFEYCFRGGLFSCVWEYLPLCESYPCNLVNVSMITFP